MSLADLTERIRGDIDQGDQLADELGVEQHERVDVVYSDLEALLRVVERLEHDGIIDVSEADDIVAEALCD
ncbi:hypothetical protein [Nonomuraea sp. bgisy101]|uniref:hypothetical protein n=1 Tax=Nonomuraea sp. bgisy101 TaxID=3413784 RepID=UPI003D7217FB